MIWYKRRKTVHTVYTYNIHTVVMHVDRGPLGHSTGTSQKVIWTKSFHTIWPIWPVMFVGVPSLITWNWGCRTSGRDLLPVKNRFGPLFYAFGRPHVEYIKSEGAPTKTAQHKSLWCQLQGNWLVWTIFNILVSKFLHVGTSFSLKSVLWPTMALLYSYEYFYFQNT